MSAQLSRNADYVDAGVVTQLPGQPWERCRAEKELLTEGLPKRQASAAYCRSSTPQRLSASRRRPSTPMSSQKSKAAKSAFFTSGLSKFRSG